MSGKLYLGKYPMSHLETRLLYVVLMLAVHSCDIVYVL